MARPRVILQSDFPYHVGARCVNREQFPLPMDEVWQIFSRQLCFVTWAYDVRIYAFVLMSNHFHLLISTPQANLSQMMANFMRETSRHINEASQRINQAYGGRYFRSVIGRLHYFQHVYKYVVHLTFCWASPLLPSLLLKIKHCSPTWKGLFHGLTDRRETKTGTP